MKLAKLVKQIRTKQLETKQSIHFQWHSKETLAKKITTSRMDNDVEKNKLELFAKGAT